MMIPTPSHSHFFMFVHAYPISLPSPSPAIRFTRNSPSANYSLTLLIQTILLENVKRPRNFKSWQERFRPGLSNAILQNKPFLTSKLIPPQFAMSPSEVSAGSRSSRIRAVLSRPLSLNYPHFAISDCPSHLFGTLGNKSSRQLHSHPATRSAPLSDPSASQSGPPKTIRERRILTCNCSDSPLAFPHYVAFTSDSESPALPTKKPLRSPYLNSP